MLPLDKPSCDAVTSLAGGLAPIVRNTWLKVWISELGIIFSNSHYCSGVLGKKPNHANYHQAIHHTVRNEAHELNLYQTWHKLFIYQLINNFCRKR